MTRILDYIAEHLGQDVGIDDLAALVNLSTAQFSRRFVTTVGISPYRFLQQKRVERAVDLMHGRQSLAEIAQEVGFTGQSHFMQAFRQVLGTTPARARKTLQ